jgi:hypothetical protein
MYPNEWRGCPCRPASTPRRNQVPLPCRPPQMAATPTWPRPRRPPMCWRACRRRGAPPHDADAPARSAQQGRQAGAHGSGWLAVWRLTCVASLMAGERVGRLVAGARPCRRVWWAAGWVTRRCAPWPRGGGDGKPARPSRAALPGRVVSDAEERSSRARMALLFFR